MFLTRIYSLISIGVLIFFSACLKDKYQQPETCTAGYPADVDAIITKKCATAGCHNTTSKSTAGNLDLSTMQHMLEGNNIGATIVAYAPGQSPMLYFTNTDSTLGPKLLPNMPYNQEPLSRDEFLTLKNCVTALGHLVPNLNTEQKAELIPLLDPVARHYREPRIRLDAEGVLASLKAPAAKQKPPARKPATAPKPAARKKR